MLNEDNAAYLFPMFAAWGEPPLDDIPGVELSDCYDEKLAKDAKKMACEVLPPLKIDEALDVWSQIPTWLPPMYTVVRLLWLCKGVPGPRSAYAVDLPPSDAQMSECPNNRYFEVHITGITRTLGGGSKV